MQWAVEKPQQQSLHVNAVSNVLHRLTWTSRLKLRTVLNKNSAVFLLVLKRLVFLSKGSDLPDVIQFTETILYGPNKSDARWVTCGTAVWAYRYIVIAKGLLLSTVKFTFINTKFLLTLNLPSLSVERCVVFFNICTILSVDLYEGQLESKERFSIQIYLLIIGKKQNMQVLSHTFTYFST